MPTLDLSTLLLIEQTLNGVQFGVMLFLMAAGLTLIFGVMGLINLAHGSLYMVGAFAAAAVAGISGPFILALIAALSAAAIAGVLIEVLIIRRLYDRDHLDQLVEAGVSQVMVPPRPPEQLGERYSQLIVDYDEGDA